jgi:hypothetical protein
MADVKLDQQQQVIRLPLYAHEEQRQGNANNSDSRSMQDQFLVNCYPMVFRDPVNQDKPVVKIQSRLGWSTPETDVNLNFLSSPTTAYPKAILNMTQLSDVLVIAYVDGSQFRIIEYRPNANTCTSLGTIAFGGNFTADDYVHLSELTIGATYDACLGVVISNAGLGGASIGYYALAVGGTLSGGVGLQQITDADYPPNMGTPRKAVGPLVQLNNVVYQMTETGHIHGSSPDIATAGIPARITVWDTSGFVRAQSYPDRGLGLVRYKHHLVAFGEESIEFYNDEGIAAPAIPIARTEQAFIKMGAMTQKAFINVDDVLWWVGKSYSGHISLYRLDGYQPTLVGQPTQQRLVADRPYGADLQIITMHGVRHIITNLKAEGGVLWFNDGTHTGDSVSGNTFLSGNLCFCIESNAWWLWASEHALTNSLTGMENFYTTTMYRYGSVARVCLSNIADSGTVYGLHPRFAFPYYEASVGEGYYDAYRVGNSASIEPYRIPMMVGTNLYDFENRQRKFIRSGRLIGDYIRNYNPGGTPWTAFNTEGLTLNFGVDKTDDITQSNSPEIIRGKPLLVETGYRYNFNNLGSGRQFKFFWSINTYVPIRLEAMELTLAQGTH